MKSSFVIYYKPFKINFVFFIVSISVTIRNNIFKISVLRDRYCVLPRKLPYVILRISNVLGYTFVQKWQLFRCGRNSCWLITPCRIFFSFLIMNSKWLTTAITYRKCRRNSKFSFQLTRGFAIWRFLLFNNRSIIG